MAQDESLFEDLRFFYHRWRHQLWFWPAVMGALTLLLFALVMWFDYGLALGYTDVRTLPIYFSGGPDASRDLLAAIVTAMATIMTVAFSITVLTLQLASSQYTPRLLQTFSKSGISQFTLGILVSTVAFSILILSVVRNETDTQAAFVPDIAVNIAKLMTLVALAMVIYFIGHVANLISPSAIIRSARRDTLQAYRAFVEQKIGRDAPPQEPGESRHRSIVRAKSSGYIQRMRPSKLTAVARALAEGEHSRLIARVTVGDYVKAGDTLAELASDDPIPEQATKNAVEAFAMGQNRLLEEDFRYGVEEIYGIALRRINQMDSSTAIECVLALSQVWLRMMEQPLYPPDRWIEQKHTQVLISFPPIDINTQLSAALRGIQRHALDQYEAFEVVSAVHEALSTVARESARRDLSKTFEAAWTALLWSTQNFLEKVDEEEYLRRLVADLLPIREAIPDRWPEMADHVRRLTRERNVFDQLQPLWE